MQGNNGRFLYVVVSGGVTYIKGFVMVTRGRIQNCVSTSPSGRICANVRRYGMKTFGDMTELLGILSRGQKYHNNFNKK
jgi:hypothetical protein